MNWVICDICQQKDMTGKGYKWTRVNLGFKLAMHINLEDVCPDCTHWLIQEADKRSKSA